MSGHGHCAALIEDNKIHGHSLQNISERYLSINSKLSEEKSIYVAFRFKKTEDLASSEFKGLVVSVENLLFPSIDEYFSTK